jgi:hypothetical protein
VPSHDGFLIEADVVTRETDVVLRDGTTPDFSIARVLPLALTVLHTLQSIYAGTNACLRSRRPTDDDLGIRTFADYRPLRRPLACHIKGSKWVQPATALGGMAG